MEEKQSPLIAGDVHSNTLTDAFWAQTHHPSEAPSGELMAAEGVSKDVMHTVDSATAMNVMFATQDYPWKKQKLETGAVCSKMLGAVLWRVVDRLVIADAEPAVRQASASVGDNVERETFAGEIGVIDAIKQHPWKRNKS